MARIQVLPEHVVAQIAAGEVIERPASVLKELLENSIDAGASRLDVEVGQGGIDFVRVVDDGGGIEADDFPLAFATHATSKLRDAAELFSIGTLGFRGEGLASIGAVAQVTLQSRPRDHDRGAEIRCDGGKLSDVRVWNGAPGTRIEVRHLFFNTPVRKKFLRGPATEMAQVSETFTRLALSQLSLQMTLRHNGRLVHEVPAGAGLLDRIAAFFGDPLRRKLIAVEAEQGGLTLGGYVADPAHEAGGTQMQYVFVNGRWVRDKVVSQALQEAYRGLQLTGKHPVCFLFLELPPDGVDVNVHPTKAEVRFRQPEKVQSAIVVAVRKALGQQDLTATLRVPEAPVAVAVEQTELPFAAAPLTPRPPLPQRGEGEKERSVAAPVREGGKEASYKLAPREEVKAARPSAYANGAVARPEAPPRTQTPAPASAPEPSAPAPRPVRAMQMHGLYLVVEVPEGVLIIDQHALHERILFEQLKSRLASGKVEVQKLLIPESVNLLPTQAAKLLQHKDDLAALGLEIDDFGGGTVLLSAYPAVLGRQPPREVLSAVVEHLSRSERPPSREALLNDLMALLACHSAVRAGDRLAPEEIAYLLEQRHVAEDSHHCPHGRPSSLLFTRAELDRQFRRT
jgi:DNA mismatch repair protein MutL